MMNHTVVVEYIGTVNHIMIAVVAAAVAVAVTV